MAAAQTSPVPAPLPEGQQLGTYRIVRKISSGGFSIVYLAQDEHGRAVAIKEYLPGSLAQRRAGELAPVVAKENLHVYRIGLKYFFEEGRTLALIFHPNIVRVLNFFRANDTVYMVMQYETGRSLQEQVQKNRNQNQKDVLSEQFIRRVFVQVLEGLKEVHSNRLLHLDIKPANIYLRMNGEPILLDFGAARQTLQRDITQHHPMYTPGFAAPELYKRDAELGAWTDVYSIGASIYACMAGKAVQEAEKRQRNDEMPAKIRALRGLYSAELISLVSSCLKLNSLERPQNVLAVQNELKRSPETTKLSTIDRVQAQWNQMRSGIERFAKQHNITWF